MYTPEKQVANHFPVSVVIRFDSIQPLQMLWVSVSVDKNPKSGAQIVWLTECQIVLSRKYQRVGII